MREMFQSGELQQLLASQQASAGNTAG